MNPTSSDRTFVDRLSSLAELGVSVGLNLQRDQELIVNAPIEASALVQHVARAAYERGAKLVTCLYDDPTLIAHRFAYAGAETLDYAPAWFHRGAAEALGQGAARLYVVGPYPDLLSGVPPDKIVRVHRALAAASQAEGEFTSASRINWTTLPFATGSWAAQVFPDLPIAEAVLALWDAIFDATRVATGDPRATWSAHSAALNARRAHLQSLNLAALRFEDGRTDLTIGLVDGHRWAGGSVVAANGVEGVCNIPTEEIFTCPHRLRTQGRLVSSKPLALGGVLVENLTLEFRDGLVTSVRADRGQEMVEQLTQSDAGARLLGEIGLVPSSSRIAQRNLLFFNALFDENAASHVALGNAYAACLPPSDASTPGAVDGANQSAIHIDVMFGTPSMDVDGISHTGARAPIMRQGEFVI